MPSAIEELVSENIEEMAVDEVIGEEHTGSKHHSRKRRWELWVALSSSLLAVLSAMAALLATFASDEAAIALSKEGEFAIYAESTGTARAILKSKLDILASMGVTPMTEDQAEVDKLEKMRLEFEQKMNGFDTEGDKAFHIHDLFAIALTLFQVTMLLGGLAVMVERPAIWVFGLSFTGVGLVFLGLGLMRHFT